MQYEVGASEGPFGVDIVLLEVDLGGQSGSGVGGLLGRRGVEARVDGRLGRRAQVGKGASFGIPRVLHDMVEHEEEDDGGEGKELVSATRHGGRSGRVAAGEWPAWRSGMLPVASMAKMTGMRSMQVVESAGSFGEHCIRGLSRGRQASWVWLRGKVGTGRQLERADGKQTRWEKKELAKKM